MMFEGVPTYPDAGRFWEVCEKHKVNQFYTAPTAIRALQAFGTEFVEKYDLSSLIDAEASLSIPALVSAALRPLRAALWSRFGVERASGCGLCAGVRVRGGCVAALVSHRVAQPSCWSKAAQARFWMKKSAV